MKPAELILHATDHCAYCPTLCMHACPVSTAECSDVVTPWGKMSLARWIASGRTDLTAETAAVLYKCTGCGACQDACRHSVDVAEALRHARKQAIDAGAAPYGTELFDVPVESDDDAILPVGVSGYRLWAAGYADRFRQVAGAAARRWVRRPELVLASADDARCIRDVYSEVGIQITSRVVLASERPGAAPFEAPKGPVAYHEACNIARGLPQDAEVVRANARSAADGDLIELRWTGPQATCCGAGGAYAATSEDGARIAAQRILDNALLKGAKTLLTGCAGCAAHLDASKGERAIEVLSIGTGPETC